MLDLDPGLKPDSQVNLSHPLRGIEPAEPSLGPQPHLEDHHRGVLYLPVYFGRPSAEGFAASKPQRETRRGLAPKAPAVFPKEMKAMIVTFLKDVQLKPQEIRLPSKFAAGGAQGRIYKIHLDGRDLAIKIITAHNLKNASHRAALLRQRMNENLPSALCERALPIGTGYVMPTEIGLANRLPDQRFLDVLVFNWVDGATLKDYFSPALGRNRPQPPGLFPAFMDALAYLESKSVVHPDLHPDNVLIDAQGRPHVFDLEGAGILNREGQWLQKPTVYGKPFDGFPNPPGFISPDIYSQRWFGTLLATYIKLDGQSAFSFLKRTDEVALNQLYEAADKSRAAWPPYGAEETQFLSVPSDELAKMRRYFLNRASDRLVNVLFNTLVLGMRVPANRWSFKTIQAHLGLTYGATPAAGRLYQGIDTPPTPRPPEKPPVFVPTLPTVRRENIFLRVIHWLQGQYR